jgi:redox-sensing transcriptional repressor
MRSRAATVFEVAMTPHGVDRPVSRPSPVAGTAASSRPLAVRIEENASVTVLPPGDADAAGAGRGIDAHPSRVEPAKLDGALPGVRVPEARVPEATVARLAVYLRVLGDLAATGGETVSSEDLAAAAGVNSAKLRKDLSYIGSNGTRGVGYEVTRLVRQIEQVLGLTHRHAVALVGVGNLGHALAGYGGFAGRGFPLCALFDVDPDLVGIHINGIQVRHVDEIGEACRRLGVTIGVIATPSAAAQAVCDQLVAAGVRSILNFAPAVLQVPEQVEVRKVDLAVELQILSFHVARRTGTGLNGAGLDGAGVNGAVVNGVNGVNGKTVGAVITP